MIEEDDRMPIHDKCGLPAELCTCPDAEVKWDEEIGMFIDQKKDEDI